MVRSGDAPRHRLLRAKAMPNIMRAGPRRLSPLGPLGHHVRSPIPQRVLTGHVESFSFHRLLAPSAKPRHDVVRTLALATVVGPELLSRQELDSPSTVSSCSLIGDCMGIGDLFQQYAANISDQPAAFPLSNTNNCGAALGHCSSFGELRGLSAVALHTSLGGSFAYGPGRGRHSPSRRSAEKEHAAGRQAAGPRRPTATTSTPTTSKAALSGNRRENRAQRARRSIATNASDADHQIIRAVGLRRNSRGPGFDTSLLAATTSSSRSPSPSPSCRQALRNLAPQPQLARLS